MKLDKIRHEFVELIPDNIAEGVLYVSIKYATAAHKCCCGCGSEVVTPISPTDWLLKFDGETISLEPSIGSWSLPCKSHYWITCNKVDWSYQWSEKKIAAGKAREIATKKKFFSRREKEA